MRLVAGVLVVGLGVAGCAPVVQFPAPPIDPHADEAERATQYAEYRLSLEGDSWGGYRYSSPYAARMLGRSPASVRFDTTRLFARYEDTRRTRAAAHGLALAGLGACVVGGALIGVAVGAAIIDPHNTGFLPGAERIGVGVAGAGTTILGLVLVLVGQARYRRLGSMYNRDLRQELNLAGRAPRRGRPLWVRDATGIRLAW